MATQTASKRQTTSKSKTTKTNAKSATVSKGLPETNLSPVVKTGRSSLNNVPKTKIKEYDSKQQREDIDLNHFRTLLIDERKRLEEELEQVRNQSTDMDNALPEDGEGGDEDTADLASAMMDKEMDLSVEDELEDLLVQVDRAFQKIEEGTYGICDVSGKPIPASRLELIPFATLTVECQSLAEG